MIPQGSSVPHRPPRRAAHCQEDHNVDQRRWPGFAGRRLDVTTASTLRPAHAPIAPDPHPASLEANDLPPAPHHGLILPDSVALMLDTALYCTTHSGNAAPIDGGNHAQSGRGGSLAHLAHKMPTAFFGSHAPCARSPAPAAGYPARLQVAGDPRHPLALRGDKPYCLAANVIRIHDPFA